MPNEDKCQTIFAEVSICIFTEINGQAYVNLHSALLLIRKQMTLPMIWYLKDKITPVNIFLKRLI